MTAMLYAPQLKDLQRALARASRDFRARSWTVFNMGQGVHYVELYDGSGLHVATITSEEDPKDNREDKS